MRAPGIGSGLPVADWVDMMVKAEATPKLKQFQKQQQTLDTQISSYGKLKSALTEFQDSLEKMQKMRPLISERSISSVKSRLSPVQPLKMPYRAVMMWPSNNWRKSRKPIWPLLRLIPNLMPVSWILLLVEKAFPLM